MKHATLYRKWRPRAFSGIVGQEPVVRTLKRAIETDRVAHAYLFSGPRGTGKTSTAKVLAMGLNCQGSDRPTPEPDGTCESCRAIINNSSMDVLEMDAASNRGIDEIRELRDKVNLAPAAGRMKVYIIDEVHMLTTEAFNALLKMLEEPPEHVVFVLATTEKHKVLPTIISRCQSFDFRRPGVETLAKKLREIADAEGIEVEPEALTVIAREGKGSFRDAEGLLDQLSSFSEGRITASMVRELLGSVGPESLRETTAALYERRAADALKVLDRLPGEGRDLGQFAGGLISHLRNLMLLPHAPEVALAEVGAEERGPLQEQANAIPTAGVVRLLEALGDALGRIKRGGDPKLELELTFLKLTRDYTEPDVGTLLRRLETLEKAVENGGFSTNTPTPPAPTPAPASETAKTDELAEITESEVSQAMNPERESERPAPAVVERAPESLAEVDKESSGGTRSEDGGEDESIGRRLEWNSVLRDLIAQKQKSSETIFKEAEVSGFDGETLELVFPEEQKSLLGLAKDSRYVEPLRKVLKEHLGVRPRLEVRVAGEPCGTAREKPPESAKIPQEIPSKPAPEKNEPHGMPERVQGDGPGAANASASGAANGPAASAGVEERDVPERGTGDDIIRDQREVFEMARERFDLFGQDGGS